MTIEFPMGRISAFSISSLHTFQNNIRSLYVLLNCNTLLCFVSVPKKITHIFSPRLDSNPPTSKMIHFCRLVLKLTQPRSYVKISTIIVGLIQMKILSQISKLCHKTAHLLMANILACLCTTTYVL